MQPFTRASAPQTRRWRCDVKRTGHCSQSEAFEKKGKVERKENQPLNVSRCCAWGLTVELNCFCALNWNLKLNKKKTHFLNALLTWQRRCQSPPEGLKLAPFRLRLIIVHCCLTRSRSRTNIAGKSRCHNTREKKKKKNLHPRFSITKLCISIWAKGGQTTQKRLFV